MSKIKLLLILIAITGGAYFFFNHTQTGRSLAASNEFLQELQNKIYQARIFNQTVQKQSKDASQYIGFLSNINNEEFVKIKSDYAQIDVSPEQPIEELSQNEAAKTISLTLGRYEKLNSFIYKLLGQIQAASTAISNSGFDTSNATKELETLTSSLSNIEAQNSGIAFVLEKLNAGEISSKDALGSVQAISQNIHLEYEKIFSELNILIKDGN